MRSSLAHTHIHIRRGVDFPAEVSGGTVFAAALIYALLYRLDHLSISCVSIALTNFDCAQIKHWKSTPVTVNSDRHSISSESKDRQSACANSTTMPR